MRPPIEDFDGGYYWGKISISVMKKAGAEKLMPRVYYHMYGSISLFKQPFQGELESHNILFVHQLNTYSSNKYYSAACVEKHLECYEQGALVGEIEYAIVALYMHASQSLWTCGDNLLILQPKILTYIRRTLQHKQEVLARCLLVVYSLLLKLIGSEEDCYAKFIHCSEADLLDVGNVSAQPSSRPGFRFVCQKHIFFSVYSGDMDAALQWWDMAEKCPRGLNPRYSVAVYAEFLYGLVALHFARVATEENDRDWAAKGEAAIKLMKRWSDSSEWNFVNKFHLMLAESYFAKGEEDKAIESYNESIEAAKAHRFLHEEGLANYKAARFHIHYGRKEEALMHFHQAKDCYERWGARSLVKNIQSEIQRLNQ